MPSRFSEVIRDHQQLKSTIAQIEQMKNKIKNNEKQMFPPQSFALRSGAEAIGPSDFGEGTRAGDLAQQLDIITSLNALLQSVVSNYLSPFQSLQLWSAISPNIPNNSANVSNYINELTDIFNYLQTESAFKPTDTGAISSLLRRVIQTAERSANPAQPIVINNFQNISAVQNIMGNPDGSNNNQPPPPAVQQLVAEISEPSAAPSSSSGSDDVDIFAQVGQQGYPSSAEENGDSNGSSNQPQRELFPVQEEFATPAAEIAEAPTTPFTAMTEVITEVKKSASKAIKAAEKELGYEKQIQEALDKSAALFPQLEKTNAINLMAYVFVGIARNKDVAWVLDDYRGTTPAAREQIIRQYNAKATDAVRLFITYQRVYFEALKQEATPGKSPAKVFGRLAESDTAHPRFIHFLMNDAEGPEYMSPAEILGYIYDNEMPEEDEYGLLVEAGMTPPSTPPARVSSVVAETPPSIQQNAAGVAAATKVPGSAPPRMSSMSGAPTPARIQDNIAGIVAATPSRQTPSRYDAIADVIAASPFGAAQGRPVRNRNPRGTYNPDTGRDQFGNGLKPVSAGRRTIKSAMNKVNDLYSAIEKGHKSDSVKNQIKSNLEFLVKKGKVSETYLNNVMKKLAKL